VEKSRFLENEVVRRYDKNPILTAEDIPIPCNSVFNPGAIKYGNQYLLLLRVEDHDRISHFRVATSDDGIHFEIAREALELPGTPETARYEINVYDARLTFFDGWYYLTTCCEWAGGCRAGLFRTRDFVIVERLGFISETEQRNVTLFPEKINNLYCRLDRPLNQYDQGNMWLSYSPDLLYWGKSSLVLETRFHSWDENKLGPACVPIKTDQGWLVIYHGQRNNASTCIYKLGVCLLDLKDPSRVLARSKHSILGPKEWYERTGDVPNVVFCSGAIVEPDGEIKIYYGACDQVVCLATTTVDELLQFCFAG